MGVRHKRCIVGSSGCRLGAEIKSAPDLPGYRTTGTPEYLAVGAHNNHPKPVKSR